MFRRKNIKNFFFFTLTTLGTKKRLTPINGDKPHRVVRVSIRAG